MGLIIQNANTIDLDNYRADCEIKKHLHLLKFKIVIIDPYTLFVKLISFFELMLDKSASIYINLINLQ